MSDNLAENIFVPEPEEHDQSSICAMEIRDRGWINVVPGTLDLALSEQGEVEFAVDALGGQTISGVLTDVTGLRSLPQPGDFFEDFTEVHQTGTINSE